MDNPQVIAIVAALVLALTTAVGVVSRAWGERRAATLTQDVSSTKGYIEALKARVDPLEKQVEALSAELSATQQSLIAEQTRQARLLRTFGRISDRLCNTIENMMALIESNPETRASFQSMVIMNTATVRAYSDALLNESVDPAAHAILIGSLTQFDGGTHAAPAAAAAAADPKKEGTP